MAVLKNITVKEMAEECRCNPQTIRRALDAGQMPAFKVGRNLLVRRCDFDKWFHSKQVLPAMDARLMGGGLHADVAKFMRKGAAA